jgi:thiosulfate dehydrogenase
MGMKKLVLVLLLAAIFAGCAQKPQAEEAPKTEKPANLVEYGKALFADASLGTNGKSCLTCHPEPSTLSGVGNKYNPKAYFNMAKKEMTLKEVINFCIEVPMKGKPLPENDERLTALEAYLKSL